MWSIFRTILSGILGYLAPRILVGAGVPLDDWAVQLGAALSCELEASLALQLLAFMSAALGLAVGSFWPQIQAWADRHLHISTTLFIKHPLNRWPVLELRKFAVANGWHHNDDSELLLLHEFMQAALDGEIPMWGRKKKYDSEELNKRELLVDIDKEHWSDYVIDWHAFYAKDDNYHIRSRPYGADANNVQFIDLHCGYKESHEWLKQALWRHQQRLSN